MVRPVSEADSMMLPTSQGKCWVHQCNEDKFQGIPKNEFMHFRVSLSSQFPFEIEIHRAGLTSGTTLDPEQKHADRRAKRDCE